MGPTLRWAAVLVGLAGSLSAAAGELQSDRADSATAGMVAIPAGSFTMGRSFSTSDDETGMRPLVLRDDRPAREVGLGAYWMDSTEVTHAAFAEFVAATGRRAPYHWSDGEMPGHLAKFPVYNVDWDDARSYCEWRGKRLPTEAEWERAARGGLDGESYPWGDAKPDRDKARYSTQDGPSAVAQHPPNAFGLYDMAGSIARITRAVRPRTPKGPRRACTSSFAAGRGPTDPIASRFSFAIG